MKFFDKLKENDKKKKLDEAKKNAINNLNEENRNNVRYLFAALFGLAAVLALSVSFYKLFLIYFLIGIFLCPIIYHNRFTENLSTTTIRVLEFIIPIGIFIILIIV